MWKRLREIIKKEFYQALREPRMRILLFLPPLIQLLIFGYAVNLDVENSQLAWMDMDRTPASRELRAAFEGSSYFHVTATPTREDEVQDLLDRGKVHAVVRVPPPLIPRRNSIDEKAHPAIREGVGGPKSSRPTRALRNDVTASAESSAV